MRVKLSLMGDMCMPIPVLLSVHDGPCLEMPTPVMWGPGFALQQNKLTKTVFHKNQFMALEGHDCGHWIPHVVPPATAFKLPLILAFSKRKVMFSSSTVKAEDSQIACAQLFGLPPLPMQTCGSPISLPTSYPVFNFLHSVSVNMTAGDFFSGVIAIVLAIASDGLGKLKWFKKGLDGFAKDFIGAANAKHLGLKMGIGLATNAARLGLTDEGDFKLEFLSNYAGLKEGIEFKRDGRSRLVIQAQGPADRGTRQYKHTHTYKDGRQTTDEDATSVANCTGGVSTTSSRAFGDDSREEGGTTKTVRSQRELGSWVGFGSGTRGVSKTETTLGEPL